MKKDQKMRDLVNEDLRKEILSLSECRQEANIEKNNYKYENIKLFNNNSLLQSENQILMRVSQNLDLELHSFKNEFASFQCDTSVVEKEMRIVELESKLFRASGSAKTYENLYE